MTTKQLMAIRGLHGEGLTNRQISEAVGLPYWQVGYYLRLEGRKPNPYRYPPKKEYTVYDARTDALLATGSARECASMLGLTLGSFYSVVSRGEHGLRGKYEFQKTDIDK